MSAAYELTRRTILLYPAGDQSVRVTTHRLLQDLGHEVLRATSADEALEVLLRVRADLLVIDDVVLKPGEPAAAGCEMLGRLAELPTNQRPRMVAIFADESHGPSDATSVDGTGVRVHVFIKPFHVHGLLSILRASADMRPAPAAGVEPVGAGARRRLA
jgi:CheY-like chemotaxis protein